MSEEPPKAKPTIADLFARIVPTPGGREDPPEPAPVPKSEEPRGYWKVMGRRKAYLFATLYVKNGFDVYKAYTAMMAKMGRALGKPRWGKTAASSYANSPWVSQYVREIVQKVADQVSAIAFNDLDEMLRINRILIKGDIRNILVQVREYIPTPPDQDGNATGGVYRLVTRLKPIEEWTETDSMAISEVRFHKTGELASVKLYDRLAAERVQMELLELIKAKGGSDTDWMQDFRQRMGKARQLSIDYEISRSGGKVVKLGLTKQSA